jgi:hypothetical protein
MVAIAVTRWSFTARKVYAGQVGVSRVRPPAPQNESSTSPREYTTPARSGFPMNVSKTTGPGSSALFRGTMLAPPFPPQSAAWPSALA